MQTQGPVLLITRPEPAGAGFALSVIEALGQPVMTILSPVIGIVPLDVRAPVPLPLALVLTSVHGADAAARMELPRGFPAWCVGGRTAEAARAIGLTALSADGDAEALIQMILADEAKGPLVHLRGENVTGSVAQRLSKAGVPCSEIVCYRQDPLPLSQQALAALAGQATVIAPLFSPRSVSILAQNAPFTAPIAGVAISEAVAEAAKSLAPISMTVASRPDFAAMRDATCLSIARHSIASGA